MIDESRERWQIIYLGRILLFVFSFFKKFSSSFKRKSSGNIIVFALYEHCFSIFYIYLSNVQTKLQKITCEHNKNENMNFLMYISMFKNIVSSLSWFYKPAYFRKTLVRADCGFAIIVCLKYDVSQVHHVQDINQTL